MFHQDKSPILASSKNISWNDPRFQQPFLLSSDLILVKFVTMYGRLCHKNRIFSFLLFTSCNLCSKYLAGLKENLALYRPQTQAKWVCLPLPENLCKYHALTVYIAKPFLNSHLTITSFYYILKNNSKTLALELASNITVWLCSVSNT